MTIFVARLDVVLDDPPVVSLVLVNSWVQQNPTAWCAAF